MENLLCKQHEKIPVAILINGRSGGKAGDQLIEYFSGFHNCHVFDVADLWGAETGKCQSAEYSRFCEVIQMENVRIVAGGGDGTVSFVCSLLDYFFRESDENIEYMPHKTQTYAKKTIPPFGILPIGVGNELSRCLGWSKRFTPSTGFMNVLCCPQEKERSFLNNVRRGPVLELDSWNVHFESASSDGKRGDHTFLCFFSLGFDANITHKFHQWRENNPKLTSSAAGNKLWYTAFGIQELFMPMENVSSYLELVVDGESIPLPTDIKTLQLFNIHSSADGIDFFGCSRPSKPNELQTYSIPTLNDGLLEAVGTTGVPHLLAIRAGMSHGYRMAQGNTFTVKIKKPFPVQLDGEGWIQPPGTVTITHRRKVPVIRGRGSTKGIPTV